MAAREAQRALASLTGPERSEVLRAVAAALLANVGEVSAMRRIVTYSLYYARSMAIMCAAAHHDTNTWHTQILAANERDLTNARESKLAGPLLKRLALSEAKVKTLADGITALADVRGLIGFWCGGGCMGVVCVCMSVSQPAPCEAKASLHALSLTANHPPTPTINKRWRSPWAASSRVWSSPRAWS